MSGVLSRFCGRWDERNRKGENLSVLNLQINVYRVYSQTKCHCRKCLLFICLYVYIKQITESMKTPLIKAALLGTSQPVEQRDALSYKWRARAVPEPAPLVDVLD